MQNLKTRFGTGSLIVIAVTLVLFIAAIFTKGWTHDLLLEAAVFLISVKLIIMAYTNGDAVESLQKRLDDMNSKIDALASRDQ